MTTMRRISLGAVSASAARVPVSVRSSQLVPRTTSVNTAIMIRMRHSARKRCSFGFQKISRMGKLRSPRGRLQTSIKL